MTFIICIIILLSGCKKSEEKPNIDDKISAEIQYLDKEISGFIDIATGKNEKNYDVQKEKAKTGVSNKNTEDSNSKGNSEESSEEGSQEDSNQNSKSSNQQNQSDEYEVTIMSMKYNSSNKIEDSQWDELKNSIEKADIQSKIDDIRVAYLGKKGKITELLKNLSSINNLEEKRELGKKINEIKNFCEKALNDKKKAILEKEFLISLQKNKIDITMPGRRPKSANVNLLTKVEEEIVSILTEIGFRVVEGNEIEDDFHNFEALNIPYYHPSRDSHDSFFISKEHVLRTHTSGMQIRTMMETKPPIAIVSPGKCARRDAIDSKHSPVFHQVEGLLVDKEISFNDLKGILELFCKKMFGDKTKIRLRPDYFPFVEPGADLSASCVICGGAGCKTCGGEGWLELMGAGMVHPNVFKHVGYEANKYTGFAFGMGVERVAMIKYGITDIRMFYENDIDFLKQW